MILKRISPLGWVQIGIVVGMFVAAAILYPSLPQQIPSHWNIAGQVDGYMSKQYGVWFAPVVALLITILLEVIPYFDPHTERYKSFEKSFDIVKVTMVGFFAYIFALQMATTLAPAFASSASGFILGGVGVLFAVMGYAMSNIKQNYFVGIRTPWTLANEDVWNKTHKMGANVWIVGGFFIAIWNAAGFAYPFVIFIGSMAMMVLVPVLYSYKAFKRLETKRR